jgi:charged multivesicular body protein 2A
MSFLLDMLKTPQQLAKEQAAVLQKTVRDLERERAKLERKEAALMATLKSAAKRGKTDSAAATAKEIVHNRRHAKRLHDMTVQMQGVVLHLRTISTTQTMADTMRKTAKLMKRMNARLNAPSINQIVMDFEQQSMKLGMTGEIISESLDGALDGDDDEEDTEDLISQVLEEVGLGMLAAGRAPTDVPVRAPPAKTPVREEETDEDAQLSYRLEMLRRE